MFSHIVTAAKGLFSGQSSDESLPTQATNDTSIPAESISNRPEMVTTRQRTASAAEAVDKTAANEVPETNGKRKSGGARAENKEGQGSKRRKRSSLEAAQDKEDAQAGQNEVAAKSESKPVEQPKKHFRFGSEEPEAPVDMGTENAQENSQANQEDNASDSDDDDAPETVDNSAQLSKMKAEAKKREQARQIEEQAKREKRRQLDDLRKQQAKSSNKKRPAEDLQSESSGTLQGSITQDTRRPAVPDLLPDDILNAVPVERPPTPPAEDTATTQKKPKKLKFLEKTEKGPKDMKVGDVTIRVLGGETSQKKQKTSLPPKASKPSRNAKQSWMNRSRSTGQVNGLRRTTGGSSGFVRK